MNNMHSILLGSNLISDLISNLVTKTILEASFDITM